MSPFRHREMWFAQAHISQESTRSDKGRHVDTLFDIASPQDLVAFVTEFKHSVTITLWKQEPKRFGKKYQKVVLVATYEVDSKHLEVYGELSEFLKR